MGRAYGGGAGTFRGFQNISNTGGHVAGAKALLTAILLQPEVLYRMELGTGEPDEHGRVRLSSRETAYALSYALDDRPVDRLLVAADEGTRRRK